MNHPAISVRSLGKLYRLVHEHKQQRNFREVVAEALLSPLRRFRELQGDASTLEDFWALRNVSFDVESGEVVGIIGRNGAGKSTLLKVLSRIVEPTEGSVVMRGRAAALLEVGTGFHPELSGRENIYLNGSILGMKKREIDSQFDAIVEFADVERFLDTPVKRYSSGMYVRLAFAVAAHLDPEILIVDEVLAVGDAAFQKKCLGKIRDISNSGNRAIIFVSHDMAAVRALCTRCIYLRNGEVAEIGDVDTVLSAYLSRPASHQSVASRSKFGLELRDLQLLVLPQYQPVHDIFFDSPAVLRLHLFSNDKFISAGVTLRVEDARGTAVSTVCSLEEGLEPVTFIGSLKLDFHIHHMRLMPGVYRVSAFVYKPNDSTAYLEAEAFLEFEVVAAVVNGGGWPYRGHHGVFRLADGCERIED